MNLNQSTREKTNWLLLEAALIVVSILLAFWIDAWWDGRKDEIEEREILVGLQVEFTDLRDRLDLWAQRNRTGIEMIDRFLSESVSQMSLTEIEATFTYAILANVLDQGGALDALMSSGRLERISDRELRARLLKWPDWLEDIHTNDLSARGFGLHEIAPFLAKHGFPGRTCGGTSFYLACEDPGPVPAAYLELAANPDFRALLMMRRGLMAGIANDHESTREQADKTLEILQDSVQRIDE